MKIFSGLLSESVTMGASRNLKKFKPELNTSYRLFFPQHKDERGVGVAVCTVAIRQLDKDACGAYSYVYDDADLNIVDPEKGLFEDMTVLAKMSKIAWTIHEAAYVSAIASSDEQVNLTMSKTGLTPKAEDYRMARDAIEKKYHGSKDINEEIPDRVYPVVRGGKLGTYTEVIAVPMSKEGAPDFTKADMYYWEISKKRQKKLNNVYSDDAYDKATEELPYIEVSFKYMGDTKARAGQDATFGYIAPYLSLKQKFPEEWKLYGEHLLENLAKGETFEDIAEQIGENCPPCNNYETLDSIWANFQKWCSTARTSIASISMLKPEVIAKSYDIIMEIPTMQDDEMKEVVRRINKVYNDNKSGAEDGPVVSKTESAASKNAEADAMATAFDSLGTVAHADKKGSGPLSKVDSELLSDDEDGLGDI